MVYFVGGLVVLVIFAVLGRAYVSASPRALLAVVRYVIGGVLIGLGLVLLLAERWGLALPALAAGISAIVAGRLGPLDLGGGRRSSGATSRVRSAHLEMALDHDSGAMRGTVTAGSFAGRSLDDLDEAEARALYAEIAGDAESRALLEAYLDRRFPGWSEDVEGDAAAGPGGAPDTGPMTDEQAYEILGLAPGAGDVEIRAAHRRLMKGVHPDRGGSTFLAAKINEAKDRLLGKHR
jgi:hypothetical protein